MPLLFSYTIFFFFIVIHCLYFTELHCVFLKIRLLTVLSLFTHVLFQTCMLVLFMCLFICGTQKEKLWKIFMLFFSATVTEAQTTCVLYCKSFKVYSRRKLNSLNIFPSAVVLTFWLHWYQTSFVSRVFIAKSSMPVWMCIQKDWHLKELDHQSINFWKQDALKSYSKY